MQGDDGGIERKGMNIIGIIPARMDSSRFPGKPLAKIGDIPMIGHVYFRSKMSRTLKEVYIATCDQEIADYAREIGCDSVMTEANHERASDRSAEALEKVEERTGKKVDIVVMIQGDEPMVRPEMIDEAVQPLIKDKSILVTNLMGSIDTQDEQQDPNEVKVVVDGDGFALYFSREPIPSWKKVSSRAQKAVPMMKQVCVIPFRRDFLYKFIRLKPTTLEEIESIDMLRALEHGYRVKMVLSKFKTYSVDTPEDLREVEQIIDKDGLVRKYANAFT